MAMGERRAEFWAVYSFGLTREGYLHAGYLHAQSKRTANIKSLFFSSLFAWESSLLSTSLWLQKIGTAFGLFSSWDSDLGCVLWSCMECMDFVGHGVC